MKVDFKESQLRKLCQSKGISYLALFGSQAREEATNDSDIDLLVRYGPDSPIKGILDHLRVQQEFETLLQKPVDLIEEKALKSNIRPHITQNLVTLYERS